MAYKKLICNVVTTFWTLVKLGLVFSSMYFMYTEGFNEINLLMFIAGQVMLIKTAQQREDILNGL
jgi:hypothetical protein